MMSWYGYCSSHNFGPVAKGIGVSKKGQIMFKMDKKLTFIHSDTFQSCPIHS